MHKMTNAGKSRGQAKKTISIVRNVLCMHFALSLSGAAYATVYTDAWTEGAILNVTIPTTSDKALLGSVRFGTSKDGLTKSQLQAIRLNGKNATLDSAGWLQYRIVGTRIVIR